MASNRPWSSGPIALTNAAANLVNPPTLAGGVSLGGATATYIIIRHFRVVNKTGSAATFSMFIGATGASAAGTEFAASALSVAANQPYDWYGTLRLNAADFLTGLASANTSLVVDFEGELGVA